MKFVLPALLAFNAGFVDTAGFLALHGLFTTHVTGNFVTFGAALALGTSGVVAKLLALPLFCLVILLVRLLGFGLRTMFSLQFVLLAAGAALAAHYGPFPDGDAPLALATGAALVSAMAIQNGAHRTYLSSVPPTTVMTLSTTQVMVDLADLIRGVAPEARDGVRKRLGPMALGVLFFALGCGSAALLYVGVKEWCFVLPAAVAFVVLLLDLRRAKAEAV